MNEAGKYWVGSPTFYPMPTPAEGVTMPTGSKNMSDIRLECLKLTVAMFIASAARGEERQLQAETEAFVKFVQTGEWQTP